MLPHSAFPLDFVRLLGVARCVCCIVCTLFYSHFTDEEGILIKHIRHKYLKVIPLGISSINSACLNLTNQ